MAENKMNEVAKLLGLELEEDFRIYNGQFTSDFIYMITKKGLMERNRGEKLESVSFNLCELLNGNWDIVKLPKEILDKQEKEYLSNIIKPFRKHIITIRKIQNYKYEFIEIVIYRTDEGASCEVISFPYFNKGKMYKGIEINKEYTLKELGL